MGTAGSGAQYQRPKCRSQEHYVVGWVCCWEPECVPFGSFLESIKIQVKSDLKFRFEFSNSLTQRHTDLSRWCLTVLPKVKHMLKIFFAISSPGGFCLQHWGIHSGVMNRTAWKDYCWLCHCCSVHLLWCLRLYNQLSFMQANVWSYVYCPLPALPASRYVYSIAMQMFVTPV